MEREKSMEKVQSLRGRWVLALAVLLLFAALTAGRAYAYPVLDGGQTVSLTVTGITEGQPVVGVTYSLYRVADMAQKENTDVAFPLTDTFKAYAGSIDLDLSFDNMTDDTWASMAASLAPYVLRDKVQVDAAAVSGSSGTAAFEGLEKGLYLMTVSYTGTQYSAVTGAPVFLALPELSGDKTAWNYQVAANSKLTKPEVFGENREKTVTARKAWKGDSSSDLRKKRPASVVVQLLDKNGDLVDEQTLSSQNGWSCKWTGLDALQDYKVVEKKVPAGYKVTTSSSRPAIDTVAYVITNTKKPGGVAGENRGKPSTPSGVAGESRSSGSAGESRLPQTGQLWWPVWLFAGAGVVLILLGLIRRHSGSRDLDS